MYLYNVRKLFSINSCSDKSKQEQKDITSDSSSLTYPTDVVPKIFWLVDSWTETLALRKFSVSK